MELASGEGVVYQLVKTFTRSVASLGRRVRSRHASGFCTWRGGTARAGSLEALLPPRLSGKDFWVGKQSRRRRGTQYVPDRISSSATCPGREAKVGQGSALRSCCRSRPATPYPASLLLADPFGRHKAETQSPSNLSFAASRATRGKLPALMEDDKKSPAEESIENEQSIETEQPIERHRAALPRSPGRPRRRRRRRRPERFALVHGPLRRAAPGGAGVRRRLHRLRVDRLRPELESGLHQRPDALVEAAAVAGGLRAGEDPRRRSRGARPAGGAQGAGARHLRGGRERRT